MKKEKLDIIYEDKYILVINKKSGLLTISTDTERENTLYNQVYTYLKQKHKSNKVFIVHRLDKDTSGLIIFAKTKEVKYALQDNWQQVIRKYYAIVNGVVEKKSDTIKSYLKTTKTNLVYVSNNNEGLLAKTEYRLLKTTNKFSLLDINILTGRKNQIRVQLASIGHNIVGDKLYKDKQFKRLALHAYYLEFIHPITKETVKLESNYPKEFNNIIQYKKN